MCLLVLALLLLSTILSCSAPRLYEGQPLPQDQVALLNAQYPAKITMFDDQAVDGRRFQVLPGMHTIQFKATKSVPRPLLPAELRTTCVASLNLVAGETYTVLATADRERIATPKATSGSVTRHQLTLDLQADRQPVPDSAVACYEGDACVVFWKHSTITTTAPCSQYDQPGFVFRDDDEDVPTIEGFAPHCNNGSDSKKIDCELEAASNLLFLKLTDGRRHAFMPADPTIGSAEAQDAALNACGAIGNSTQLEACLEKHGYVPVELQY
jgi:hypothetical protein